MGGTLRPATPGDAARISALLAQLGWPTSPDLVVAGLDQPHTFVTVAEADHQVVGVVAVTTRHHFHRGAPVTTIDTLVVDEHHRSQGIGQLLVDDAVAAAVRAGSEGIEVVSHPRRIGAHRFYERLGFQVDGHYFIRLLGDRPASRS